MFCKFCGKEIADDSTFCPNCGNSVSNVSPAVLPSSPSVEEEKGDGMNCTNCGKELQKGEHFCGNCGMKVDKKVGLKIPKKVVVTGLVSLAAMIALITVFVLVIRPKIAFSKLPEVQNIEYEINRAFNNLIYFMGETDTKYQISNFKINDVEGENYDQTFSGEFYNGNMRICGQAKNGHVIQLQTILLLSKDNNYLSDDQRKCLVIMSTFGMEIFFPETYTEYEQHLVGIEEVKDTGYDIAYRRIDDNIESTVWGGAIDNTMLVCGTIRFLPEYESGFFEEDE